MPLIPVAAAVAAVLAAAAGAQPTGLPAWDGVLTAAVVGACVLLVGRAHGPRWALVAGATAQVALRLPAWGPFGLSAVAAGSLVVVAVVAGVRPDPAVRRVVLRTGLGALGSALVVTVVAGMSVLASASRLDAGLDAADDGLRLVRSGDAEGGRRSLERAAVELGRADRALRRPWVRAAHLVPVVAQHVRAVAVGARHGASVARRGVALVADADPRRLRPRDGRIDPAAVARLAPAVRDGEQALARAVAALAGVDSPWLLPPAHAALARARHALLPAARQASDLAALVDAAPALLGGQGTRRWLLALPTPAEDRATVGIIGNYAEVTIDDGRVQVGRLGRSTDFRPGGESRPLVADAEYRRRYGRFAPQWVIENVTMSPHFPSVARVLARTHEQLGRPGVDGVLLLDPAAIAALLELTGPLPLAGFDEPLTAANVEHLLLVDQYDLFYRPGAGAPPGRGRPEAGRARRVEFLGQVAATVLDGLRGADLPDVVGIARVLGPAVRGGHLLLWSDHPSEQHLLARFGLDGALAPVRGDALGLVTQNSSGNKIDVYLQRSLDYRLELDPSTGRASATATVELRNDAPASGLPDYVIAGYGSSPTRPGENLQIVSLYTPLRAVDVRLDGRPAQVRTERERGRLVHSVSVLIPPGGTRRLELRLQGTLPRGDRYLLDVDHQATVRPDRFSFSVELPDRFRPVPTRSVPAVVEDLHLGLRWRGKGRG